MADSKLRRRGFEELRDGSAREVDTGAPEVLRGQEPDHLSDGDFREDRLSRLVRRAIEAEEISLGRGGEILGLSLVAMRSLAATWIR